MAALLTHAFARPVSLLEIGSWCGIGSTQIWLDNVRDGSRITLVDAWKPYASESDSTDSGFDYRARDVLTSDAFLSTYVAVRRFEAEFGYRNIDVQMIRADTGVFLPSLAPECFDIIYIDGDHKYDSVRSDIRHAKRLLKSNFGIICGDDLERMPSAELISVAQTCKSRDFIREPHWFHPGVLLAVSEEFEQVSMMHGFWWTVCRNGVFAEG